MNSINKLKKFIKDEVEYISENYTGGDCYEANGKYMVSKGYNDKNMKLVHGVAILRTDGKPFGHCWIEKGNKVLDFSNGKSIEMDRKKYYVLGEIPAKGYKLYKYNIEEVNEKLLNYGTWGPWDSQPPR